MAKNDFSVESKLKSLIELQKILSKLDEIITIRGELPIQVQELEDTIEGINVKKQKIEEELNGINLFIEEKKNSIATMQTQLKKQEKQSNNVKNSREYEAITKEIETLQLDIKLAERRIRNANEDILEKGRELEVVKKELTEKNFFLKQKKDDLNKIIEETSKEEAHYKKIAAGLKTNIDEQLVRSFEKIRNTYRNGLGVVSVVRSACGGCFSATPPQRHSDIKLYKNIITCENCGRILADEQLYNSVNVK